MSYTFSFNVTPPTGFSLNAQTGLITIAANAAPFTGSLVVRVSDGVSIDIKSISIALTAPTITPLINQLSENMAIGGDGFTRIELLQDFVVVAIGGGIATGTFTTAANSAAVAVTGPLVTTSIVTADGNASIVVMGPLVTTSGNDGSGGTPGVAGSNTFSTATVIPANCSPATQSLVNSGSNVGYTKEANEPPTSSIYQQTAWFKFTAPSTTSYNFSTVGSNFDTLLVVFSGTSFANLVLLASDDDSGGSATSLLNVNLTSGQQYYIQVSGYNSSSGNYTLTTSYTCV